MIWLLACTPTTPDATTDSAPRGAWSTPPPSRIERQPERLLSFADVHGDYVRAQEVLRLAGLIDDDGYWSGGTAVVVQTGDQLDRGGGEKNILELFERLSEEAWDAGGGFYPLLGNHETMNVEWDFRYVTDRGFKDWEDFPYDETDPDILEFPEEQRGRAAAFRPGAEYAVQLAGHNLVMQVGDTVFVHGGVLPTHAEAGLDAINGDVRSWMLAEGPLPEKWIGTDSPVWTRAYSDDEEPPACEDLTAALDTLGASRMVVGHTVQDEANPACDGKVWKMDVGMARYYGGGLAVLEIVDGEVAVIEGE
ncbi:MAG: calcineurin [Proteobacteria bacterium]|nr:calcineurin [Pseudomonadota bacterium]MCP4922268.1 calcineurin [Pseudomonadota bacterium]